MKKNTIAIKNSSEDFIGKYNGVEFILLSGETRYLPSDVSIHLAKQLIDEIVKKSKEPVDREELKREILGEEIMTAETVKILTFAEEVVKHEEDYKEWQEEKDKEELLKGEKVKQIIEKNV